MLKPQVITYFNILMFFNQSQPVQDSRGVFITVEEIYQLLRISTEPTVLVVAVVRCV